MTLTAGARLGPYEIVAPLGAGGMGEVYRARDPRLGREVAVKVLPESVASHPDRLARFEREARTVAALNHPNIVVLHSIEHADAVRFLTMELVEGQNLGALVTPGGLPLAHVLALAIPLADALAVAHERGVVHRDLKPANVMVTRDGRVKVLDFGLAKRADEVTLEATQAATLAAPISTAGQLVGTVPYMSPEQLRGGDVDSRTDLFSFGILLHELLTGKRPFAGATQADVASAILRDVPPPVRTARADLPPDLDRIVARCLEKDPERRFQTAKDVRNELELVRRTLESGASSAPVVAPGAPPAGDASPSIAVLPFANRSRDEDDAYFAEGLADELHNVLAKIRGLRVAARSSSAQFKGATHDIAAVGQKLRVATLLEGSVRKSGNRVRIAVQLVKVADGFQLWSETYDRTLDDIFAVQDDIAQSVVKELRAALLGETPDSKASGEVRAEVAVAAAGRGEDAEAHGLFLQGRYFVQRMSAADYERGIELLRRAVALEPRHARAWSMLSWAESTRAISTSGGLDVSIRRAREAAEHALAAAPDLAEAHLAMSSIEIWYDFDWKKATASAERALELAPDDPEAMRGMSILLHLSGRFADAETLCRRSLERDPLSVGTYSMLARALAAAGRFSEADEAFARALEISPDATSLRSLRGIVMAQAGRFDDALVEAEREKAEWAHWFGLAMVHGLAGHREESVRARERLMKFSEGAAYQVAVAHAVVGERDEAFEWLERALAEHDSGILFMRAHPFLASLHDDPRWGALVARIGYPA